MTLIDQIKEIKDFYQTRVEFHKKLREAYEKKHREAEQEIIRELHEKQKELRESGKCPHSEVVYYCDEDYHNCTETNRYRCPVCGQEWRDRRPEGSVVKEVKWEQFYRS